MYSQFISLGQACHVAASMKQYGLRSESNPFDWLVTESFPWVIHYMKNEFEDFLCRENLVSCEDGNELHFKDKKSGFVFLHENMFWGGADYNSIYQKYKKKAEKFIISSGQGVCYLRCVESWNELQWILNNEDYVQQVVKAKSKTNDIVFLLNAALKAPEDTGFMMFHMPGEYGGDTKYHLEGWFDTGKDFLEFVARNYSFEKALKNIAFDRLEQHKKESV